MIERIRTLTEWEKITGIKRKTLKSRIQNLKWSIEKALTTPVEVSRKKNLTVHNTHAQVNFPKN